MSEGPRGRQDEPPAAEASEPRPAIESEEASATAGASTANAGHGHKGVLWADLLLGAGVLVMGWYFTWGAFNIRLLPSYSRIGPRFFPLLVAAGLLLCGLLLVIQALRGQAAPLEEGEDVDVTVRPDWLAVAILAGALLLQLLLIERLGFVIASAALFWGVAFGFGSRRWLRDPLIGLGLSLLIYLAFTRLLDLNLPAGILPLLSLGVG